MEKSPAFQAYPKDWLSDDIVLRMDAEAEGTYWRLLCISWLSRPTGSLPKDPEEIQKLTKIPADRWPDVWKQIEKCFPISGRIRINRRLKAERLKQRKFSDSRKIGAGVSARSRRMAMAKRKGTHTKEEWEALVNVCGTNCLRCGAEGIRPVKDHILPIYKGGSDSLDNLQPLCARCNTSKGPEVIDYRTTSWRTLVEQVLNKTNTLQSSSPSASPEGCHNPAMPQSHTPPSNTTEAKNTARDFESTTAFETKGPWQIFYEAYPACARFSLTDVQVAWHAVPAIDRDLVEILGGLTAWAESERWREERYIPKAKNFLRDQMWKMPPPKGESKNNGRPSADPNERLKQSIRNIEAGTRRLG